MAGKKKTESEWRTRLGSMLDFCREAQVSTWSDEPGTLEKKYDLSEAEAVQLQTALLTLNALSQKADDYRREQVRQEDQRRAAHSPPPAQAPRANKQQAKEIEKAIRETLPKNALPILDAALSGDTDAATFLTVGFSAEVLGHLVLMFYLDPTLNREAYRTILSEAWDHDHNHVTEVSRTRQRLKAMFRQAAFPLPDEWGETVTLYRGTSHVGDSYALKGISWTTNRAVASWYAIRLIECYKAGIDIDGVQLPPTANGTPAFTEGYPRVYKVEVPRSSILHYTNDRHESTAICFDTEGATVDGTREEWEIEWMNWSMEIGRLNAQERDEQGRNLIDGTEPPTATA